MPVDVFTSQAGRVAVYENEGVELPGKISLDAGTGRSEDLAFLIAGVDYKQSVDVQFQTSLERDIYAYVFGDNMGEVIVHGRAYYPCPPSTESGFDDIITLYEEGRLTVRREPVLLSLNNGSKVIQGFLTSLLIKAVGLTDEPAGLVYDFSAAISAIPKVTGVPA